MRNLFVVFLALCVLSIGCEYQNTISVIDDTRVPEQSRVLNVGFYDAFSPVSYSLAHTHLQARLLQMAQWTSRLLRRDRHRI